MADRHKSCKFLTRDLNTDTILLPQDRMDNNNRSVQVRFVLYVGEVDHEQLDFVSIYAYPIW